MDSNPKSGGTIKNRNCEFHKSQTGFARSFLYWDLLMFLSIDFYSEILEICDQYAKITSN